jgi:hypothetical protein
LGTGAGIPSHFDGGASSTAEASTLQLEMKYLAHLTGKELYWRKSEEVMRVLDDNGMQDGLLPIFVHPDTGKFTSSEIRLGSRGDSYYGTSGTKSAICASIIMAYIYQSTLSSSICRQEKLSILRCGHRP